MHTSLFSIGGAGILIVVLFVRLSNLGHSHLQISYSFS